MTTATWRGALPANCVTTTFLSTQLVKILLQLERIESPPTLNTWLPEQERLRTGSCGRHRSAREQVVVVVAGTHAITHASCMPCLDIYDFLQTWIIGTTLLNINTERELYNSIFAFIIQNKFKFTTKLVNH